MQQEFWTYLLIAAAGTIAVAFGGDGTGNSTSTDDMNDTDDTDTDDISDVSESNDSNIDT